MSLILWLPAILALVVHSIAGDQVVPSATANDGDHQNIFSGFTKSIPTLSGLPDIPKFGFPTVPGVPTFQKLLTVPNVPDTFSVLPKNEGNHFEDFPVFKPLLHASSAHGAEQKIQQHT